MASPTTYPVEGGTLVRHRFEVEPHGVLRFLYPLLRPIFARSFQRDLDTMVQRLSRREEGASARQEATTMERVSGG